MNSIIDLQRFRADAFLALITDHTLGVTYSQNGEDRIICSLLKYIKSEERGIYVDVGCFHPRQFSNTFFLHYSGWRGVNIDANQASIDSFCRERPNDKSICCAVGMESGACDFYVMEPTAASTISKAQAMRFEEFGWKIVEIRQVPVRTLSSLLDEYVPENTPIDLLDVDLEGMDEFVLSSVDLNKYRPRIISAELSIPNAIDVVNTDTWRLLSSIGYRIHSICGGTFIFTDETVFHKG